MISCYLVSKHSNKKKLPPQLDFSRERESTIGMFMNSELHPRVTGISRVKQPDSGIILEPDEDGVIRAKLLSGIEIEVKDGKVTYQYEDAKITVTGGVSFDDLEILDREAMKVAQPIKSGQHLEFFSRISEDTIGFEKIIVESE